MAHDDEKQAYVPGPLDELVPGLRKKTERLRALPVHPRVVQTTRDDGSYAIVMASFAAPANVRVLHAGLKPLVEAALLAELCRPAGATSSGTLAALELYAFAEPTFDPSPALSPFAFARAELGSADARKAMALLRREAQLVDGAPSEDPLARFVAPVRSMEKPAYAAVRAALAEHAAGKAWGEQPGALSRTLSEALSAQALGNVTPTREGIELVEALFVSQQPGVVRWLDPLIFQALCDLIAVAAHASWGMETEWGVCEVDEETGLAPPPVIRVTRGTDSWHVPLGEHVLRWCVMPTRAGEVVPTLGAWAEHEFA